MLIVLILRMEISRLILSMHSLRVSNILEFNEILFAQFNVREMREKQRTYPVLNTIYTNISLNSGH